MQPQYYVRVGHDVRGPVDERTVTQWLAGGMANAEICAVGGTAFVPVEQTPFAKHVPGSGAHVLAKLGGIGGVIVIGIILGAGPILRGCNKRLDAENARTTATLPAVGATGTLHSDTPMKLCKDGKYAWGWPCGGGDIPVAEGARAQIMKAGVFQQRALCRYWVQGGATDVGGDAPCAWFVPDAPR